MASRVFRFPCDIFSIILRETFQLSSKAVLPVPGNTLLAMPLACKAAVVHGITLITCRYVENPMIIAVLVCLRKDNCMRLTCR